LGKRFLPVNSAAKGRKWDVPVGASCIYLAGGSDHRFYLNRSACNKVGLRQSDKSCMTSACMI